MIKTKQLSGHGTVATHNVGTAAGEIVVLDSQGRLPAVDGSNLSGVGAAAGSTTLRNIEEITLTGNHQLPDTYPVGTLVSITNTVSTIRDVYLPSTQSSNIGAGYYFFVGNYSTGSYKIYLKPHPSTSDTISTQLSQQYVERNDCFKVISDGAGNWIFLQRGQR